MKTYSFIQVKDFVHDASGVDNPNNYLWYKNESGIYYPIFKED